MRVAAIDIGTNTVLLLVAERTDAGTLTATEERATITRLGEGVDRTRALSPAAVARTTACLEGYARIVERTAASRVVVVGTSAMRDAGGAEELRSCVSRLFGMDAIVLSGDEEARLSFVGALSGLSERREVAVFDIGGGSTEVIVGRLREGRPELSYLHSFNLGSVRLTERFFTSDPVTSSALTAVREYARDLFAVVPKLPDPDVPPVGVAGTMTTLAAVQLALEPYDGARVHGRILPAEGLRSTVLGLAALESQTRAALPGMEPKRADVIVAGGLIAVELLSHWGATDVMVSDRGVRWGLAEELTRESSPRSATGSSTNGGKPTEL